jgi:hypothetical protein
MHLIGLVCDWYIMTVAASLLQVSLTVMARRFLNMRMMSPLLRTRPYWWNTLASGDLAAVTDMVSATMFLG